MKIREIELEPDEDITIIVNKDDYERFIEETDEILDEYESTQQNPQLGTDDFLEWLFDTLGIEVRKEGE